MRPQLVTRRPDTMSRNTCRMGLVLLVLLVARCDSAGRGFGGFRMGGFQPGGFGGGLGGFRSEGLGGERFGGLSGFRSGGDVGGAGWGRGSSSFDRDWTGARGGSLSVSGGRSLGYGRLGAYGYGGREVHGTGPGGRSFTDGREGGLARGRIGGVGAHGSRGLHGGGKLPTDWGGLGHFSRVPAGKKFTTHLWSHQSMA